MKARSVALGLSSIATLLLLAGCAVPNDEVARGIQQSWGAEQLIELSQKEALAGHETQAKRLADGEVTFDEYQAAFNDFSVCLQRAGITVSEPAISPVSNDRYEFTMDVGTLDINVGAELSDDCNDKHWVSVSQGYMFTRSPVMDTAVRDKTVACLKKEGMMPTGDEKNAFELAALPEMDHDVLTACIISAVDEVFPGLPAVTVTF